MKEPAIITAARELLRTYFQGLPVDQQLMDALADALQKHVTRPDDVAVEQALDAMARARSCIDLDRVALIDSHTNGDGILDDEAARAVEDYDTAIRDIDEAAERLAAVMREASNDWSTS